MEEDEKKEQAEETPAPAPQPQPEEPPTWAKPLIETQQAIAQTLENLTGLLPKINPSPTPENPQPVSQTPEAQPEADTPHESVDAPERTAPQRRQGPLSKGIKIRW